MSTVGRPEFDESVTPKLVVDEVGKWLAAQFDGFRWLKSRGVLERPVDTQKWQVHLQPSTWNRGGVATWVSPRFSVLDGRLQRWREHDGALNPGRLPIVYTSLLINTEPDYGSVELTGWSAAADGPAAASLDDFASLLHERVVPLFESFRSPSDLVDGLPESWVRMIDVATIEWALAREDNVAAGALIARLLSRPLAGRQSRADIIERFAHGWRRAADGAGPPPAPGPTEEALGFLSFRYQLVSPDEFA